MNFKIVNIIALIATLIQYIYCQLKKFGIMGLTVIQVQDRMTNVIG